MSAPEIQHAIRYGLYDPSREHDACGVGFVAHIKGHKSHDIVSKGLTILNNLTHRGATGADPLHGDGAGILIQIPDAFFREEMAKAGVKLPKAGAYGVGMVFLPQDPAARSACVREIERAIANEGQILLGWRDVPFDVTSLGSWCISRQLGEQQSAYFLAQVSHCTSSMLQVTSWQLPMRSLFAPHCMQVLTTSSVMRSASRSSNTKFWPL